MKTIEERALEYANELGIDSNTDYFDYCQQDYIAGATEQKDINDAELLNLRSSLEKEAQINHNDENNYKQGYHDAIEKAIQWFQLRSEYPISRLEDSFRNFMNE